MRADSIARPPIWLAACITLLMGLMFVSNDSLWIDEGNAASKALQSTIGDWYSALVSQGGSDAQMPGYMLYIWAWAKFAGHGEFALRASNIPWLVLAIFSLRRTPFLWLALLASPFVLYYLNELRPYLMQIAGAAVVLSAFPEGESPLETRWRRFLFGNLILCASSLTGVIWSAGALISYLAFHPFIYRNKALWRDLLVSSPLFLLLGAYYLQTLLKGQGAALMGGELALSFAACAYELTGLMGLGPGRIELREHPKSVVNYALPLAAGVLIFGSAYVAGLIGIVKRTPRKTLVIIAIGIAMPLAMLVALVVFKDFRLLARHLAPLSVLMAWPLASLLALSAASHRHHRRWRTVGCCAILLGLVSASALRLAERHKKDAYRDAAAMAKAALSNGRRVFWAADVHTADYYGLVPGESGIHFIQSKNTFPGIQGTDVFIMTKPDIVDPDGSLSRELEARNFRTIRVLPAFTIWECFDSIAK